MYQDLNAFKVPDDFRGKSKIVVQLWWIIEKSFFAWSPQFFYGWRRFLLRLFGAKIGKGVLIRPSAKFTYPWKISIDDYLQGTRIIERWALVKALYFKSIYKVGTI